MVILMTFKFQIFKNIRFTIYICRLFMLIHNKLFFTKA